MKWLKNLFNKPFEFEWPEHAEQLRFVTAVCEAGNPAITERWALGYLYEITLQFQDGIKINVEYNYVRQTWDMQIWSSESKTILYYYDCLSPRPWSTINYLIDRYGLKEKVEQAIAEKNAKKANQKSIEQEIKDKYLKSPFMSLDDVE